MARDVKRIRPVLAEIERIWYNNPDLRFGQLVSLIYKNGIPDFYREDEEFIKDLKKVK